MEVTKISGLSPVEFLRNFNDMTQNFNQTESILKQVRKKDGSKLTEFKKFPIPDYYTSMEGLNVDDKQKVSVHKINRNLFNKKD